MDKDQLRIEGKIKKAIIFDCDNTLWHGVVGEDEIQTNEQIQKDAVFLSQHGVIIGICSRNNRNDIENTLKKQILNDDFISVKRINWNDKVQSLKEIAEELNIGLDSMVFVDDSDFEINSVNERLSDVMAIYPHELMSTVHKWFDLTGGFTKTQQYKEQLARKREKEKFGEDYDAYLASLDMIMEVKINDRPSLDRITELTQKTNQFNLTTIRHNKTEILRLMHNHGLVFSATIKDKFGDNGLTAVVILDGNNIDTFLMSCRIIGRNIEYSLMDYVVRKAIDIHAYSELFCSYIPTKKNHQVADFYDNIGAKLLSHKSSIKQYKINTLNYKNQGRDYICAIES